MVPPCLPVKALMSAEEFMYETGTVTSAICGVGEHVPALGDLLGGGHVGHRTAGREVGEDDLLRRAGQDVRGLRHEVHAAEHDVLGLRAGGGVPGELERVARDVGELDDLVALVVVAEDEDAVAEGGLGRAGPLDEVGVGGGGQVPGALDAALAVGVGLAAEQQQGERRRGGVDAVGLSGGGHGRVPSCRRPGLSKRPSRLSDVIYHNPVSVRLTMAALSM